MQRSRPDTRAVPAPMTELTVRRLLVDLESPLPRHWCGGDAFRTAFMNALSMSFPAGEQLFIDSVRKAMAELHVEPAADLAADSVADLAADLAVKQRERLATEVQAFIGQEATHRRIHERFNAHLARQGLVNGWEPRIHARRSLLEAIDTRNWIAVTAATEHFTAVFAEYLLSQAAPLAGTEPRLAQMWLWHCAEESEHRSTAFDIYAALGGNHEWRCRVFKAVAWTFAGDAARQVGLNLWHDGSWWRFSTWTSGWTLLFGRSGLLRLGYAPLKRYLRTDFHPSQGDGSAGVRWLAANAGLAPPLKAPLSVPPRPA